MKKDYKITITKNEVMLDGVVNVFAAKFSEVCKDAPILGKYKNVYLSDLHKKYYIETKEDLINKSFVYYIKEK